MTSTRAGLKNVARATMLQYASCASLLGCFFVVSWLLVLWRTALYSSFVVGCRNRHDVGFS